LDAEPLLGFAAFSGANLPVVRVRSPEDYRKRMVGQAILPAGELSAVTAESKAWGPFWGHPTGCPTGLRDILQ
jgi:hypothetical protein